MVDTTDLDTQRLAAADQVAYFTQALQTANDNLATITAAIAAQPPAS